MGHLHLLLLLPCFTLFFLLSHPDPSLAFPPLPQSDPLSIQPFRPTNQTTPTTIPAFPEQSDLSTCPLDLPTDLFHAISSACSASSPVLTRSNCCPALAASLYSAYSATALRRAAASPAAASPLDLPLLPDDSETCVENLEKALKGKGIQLKKPNETCDVVYCYCGIRLHPLTCPESFTVTKQGGLVGHDNVKALERACLNEDGNSSIAACSKCLKSLYKLTQGPRVTNTSRSSDRKTKMHSRDCHLMGLTWLLAKNRTAYIPTVTSVIRALMMNTNGSDFPKSCSLASDGMPLAVDSAELDGHSSSITHRYHVALIAVPLFTTLSFMLF
ncbi:hypothetical protein Sjap_024856 [Stephania japonica]|uniref:SPARK domain-containing protein n=1 Tax=Stephania japonica TaxID=461633 RepID=A0AAP0HLX1_9MAGN